MIVLGLLLVLLGLAVVAAAVVTGDTGVLLAWHQYAVRTPLVAVFLTGAAALLLVELGVLLMRGGSAREATRWRERRRLRELEREQARLEREQARLDGGADAGAVRRRGRLVP